MELLFSYMSRYTLHVFPVFLVILPLLVFWKKGAPRHAAYRYFWAYLLAKTLIGFVMLGLAAHTRNSIPFYHLEILLRFTLLLHFFREMIQKKLPDWLFYSLILAFWLFTLYDIQLANPNLLDWHNHAIVFYANTLECALISLAALYYLYETLRFLPVENILTDCSFWCIAGLLLFYSTSIIITPFMHYMFKWDVELDLSLYVSLEATFEITSLGLFSIGSFYFKGQEDGASR
jgi:hypothetical protein